jgi:hypothetical protein
VEGYTTNERSSIVGSSIGGWSNLCGRLNTVEQLNAEMSEWTKLECRLKSCRDCHSATVVGEAIYIVGGDTADSSHSGSVEKFNIVERKFERHVAPLSVGRIGHAACSVVYAKQVLTVTISDEPTEITTTIEVMRPVWMLGD